MHCALCIAASAALELERFQIMCSRKGRIGRKDLRFARNTETFVAAGRRGDRWAWPVASTCKHVMRHPMPRDASIAAAVKGHGSPAGEPQITDNG